ncbi:MAG: hypothetical protein ACRDNO_01435 [Trebonia sp.]
MPVDRPAPRCQARRERAEGQGALAVGVEDLDRGVDDSLLGERDRAPFSLLDFFNSALNNGALNGESD